MIMPGFLAVFSVFRFLESLEVPGVRPRAIALLVFTLEGTKLPRCNEFEKLKKRLLRVALTPQDISDAPLKITTEHYYYKPVHAFLGSFSLRAFRTAKLRLEGPILDVGCGDGTFSAMLKRTVGCVGHTTGIDLSSGALHKARRNVWQPYSLVVRGDATELPFADGAFRTIYSNESITSIGPSFPNALREILRVLAPDGQFYCTVPTKLFRENYLLARLLRKVGFSNLAGRYVDSMDRRCAQLIYHTTQDWIGALNESGFINIHVVGFFTPTHMTYWSILGWTPFRILSILRIFPIGVVHQLAARLEQKLFSSVYRRTPDYCEPDDCVYVLIHGSKKVL
jgi:ubiquinone/menaquinone biosynthesis C-methylase UbiE